MDNQELSFVELNQSKVTDDVIQQFDCGNEDMTEYLHKYAKNDSIEGKRNITAQNNSRLTNNLGFFDEVSEKPKEKKKSNRDMLF